MRIVTISSLEIVEHIVTFFVSCPTHVTSTECGVVAFININKSMNSMLYQ